MLAYQGYQKFWVGIIGAVLQGANLYLPQVVEVSAEVTQSLVVVLSVGTALLVRGMANK